MRRGTGEALYERTTNDECSNNGQAESSGRLGQRAYSVTTTSFVA